MAQCDLTDPIKWNMFHILPSLPQYMTANGATSDFSSSTNIIVHLIHLTDDIKVLCMLLFIIHFTLFTLFFRVFEGPRELSPTHWTKLNSKQTNESNVCNYVLTSNVQPQNNFTAIYFWESPTCNHVNIDSKQAIQNHKNISFIHKMKYYHHKPVCHV